MLDFKWCEFKYKYIKINIEQNFDNIANDEDKKQLKMVINVKYTFPLIAKFVDEQNNKYKTQCLFGDNAYKKIESFFTVNNLDYKNYYFVCDNKKYFNFYYNIFYEMISEEKFQNSLYNNEINDTIKSFPTTENLNQSDKININDKEKIMNVPINETNKT